MKIEIGKTIAHMRHERGITQEQLAEAIGISAPAVSKWETGQSYPDITLLPPLARYFGVPVDTLLAYTPSLTDAEREVQTDALDAVFAASGWDAGTSACEALLHQYPADATLRIMLMGLLMKNGVFATTDAQREASYALQEKWLLAAQAVADSKTLPLVQQMLGTFYIGRRRLEEAEAILTDIHAEVVPDVSQALSTLRTLQGRTEEAEALTQRNLSSAIVNAMQALLSLTSLAMREKQVEKVQRYAVIAHAVADAVGLGGHFASFTAQIDMNAAFLLDDKTAMLAATKAYASALMHLGEQPKDTIFDRIFTPDNAGMPHQAAYDRALLERVAKDFESSDAYAVLRDEPAFKALIASLRAPQVS